MLKEKVGVEGSRVRCCARPDARNSPSSMLRLVPGYKQFDLDCHGGMMNVVLDKCVCVCVWPQEADAIGCNPWTNPKSK